MRNDAVELQRLITDPPSSYQPTLRKIFIAELFSINLLNYLVFKK